MPYSEITSKSKDLSIQELKKLIGSILSSVDYGSIYCRNQTFSGLYRARQHEQIDGESDKYSFTNEKEFWNPPECVIKKIGRCNNIEESMFYCSNQFETAIVEVRPQANKFITVANFLPHKRDNQLPSFRIKPNCIQHLKKIKDFKSCIADYNLSERNSEFIKVDNLLDDLFTEIVQEDEAHKYKITNAITQCMLHTKLVNENGDQYSMNGMIYPSIADNLQSINILMKPIYVINHYYINCLQTFKVLEVTKKNIKVQLVRNGSLKGKKEHPSEQLDIFWHPKFDGPIENIKF